MNFSRAYDCLCSNDLPNSCKCVQECYGKTVCSYFLKHVFSPTLYYYKPVSFKAMNIDIVLHFQNVLIVMAFGWYESVLLPKVGTN